MNIAETDREEDKPQDADEDMKCPWCDWGRGASLGQSSMNKDRQEDDVRNWKIQSTQSRTPSNRLRLVLPNQALLLIYSLVDV